MKIVELFAELCPRRREFYYSLVEDDATHKTQDTYTVWEATPPSGMQPRRAIDCFWIKPCCRIDALTAS
ncbi:MAG TPA: hypothetical protein VFK04_19890 [Gemmatimonadaceae bacterium]|nr:hypothetical protein [Gemmatimonadaceae bacterium]